MEPLIALGIACNVMQVISFGHEAVSMCQRVYQSGSPLYDDSFDTMAQQLAVLSTDLAADLMKQSLPLNRGDKTLADIANGCAKAVKDILDELGFLKGKRKDLVAALKITAQVNWRRKRLKRLEESIGKWQKTMETGILVRLSQKIQSLDVEQKSEFQSLNGQLQSFIRQLATGNTTLSQLITLRSGEVKSHITLETAQATESMKAHVTEEKIAHEKSLKVHMTTEAAGVRDTLFNRMQQIDIESTSERTRDRFLQSLKFPAMNERRNQIKDNFPSTFYWVLGIQDNSDLDSSCSDESENSSASWETLSTGEIARSTSRDPSPRPCSAFVEWLESRDNLYWISGKPGSGKSTLVKFISSRPETRGALSNWRPNPRIISHYIWMAGSPIQRSIKGILCSFFYQSVEASDHYIDMLLESHPQLRVKDSVSDWTVGELRDLVMEFFRASNESFCIFLDGLDEISPEDGAEGVVRLVEELGSIPQVKVCVSSRPEPAFQNRLGGHPALKVHQLTQEDIKTYARSLIHKAASEHGLPVRQCEDLIETIREKADGVFLWVVLVVQSLIRGIENGDRLYELQRRLDIMPRDLGQLFDNMLLRLEDDIEIYGSTSALYFRLALASIALGNIISRYTDPITVMDIALASSTTLPREIFMRPGSIMTTETKLMIEERCISVLRNLKSRCAGLLETVRGGWERDSPKDLNLAPYAYQTVRFIHRSVVDFFNSESTGRRYMQACTLPTSMAITRLFSGYLIINRFFVIDHRISCLDRIKDLIQVWNHSGFPTDGIPIEAFCGLICLYQNWLDRGLVLRTEPPLSVTEDIHWKNNSLTGMKYPFTMIEFVLGSRTRLATQVAQKHFELSLRDIQPSTTYVSRLLRIACDFKLDHDPLYSVSLRIKSRPKLYTDDSYTCLVDRLRLIRYLLGHGADPSLRAMGDIIQPLRPWKIYNDIPRSYTSSFHAVLTSMLSALICLNNPTVTSKFRHSELRVMRAEFLETIGVFDTHNLDPAVRTCVGLYLHASDFAIFQHCHLKDFFGAQVQNGPSHLYYPGVIQELSSTSRVVLEGGYIVILEIDLHQFRRWVLYELDPSTREAPEFTQIAHVRGLGKKGAVGYDLEAEDSEHLLDAVLPLLHRRNRQSLRAETDSAYRRVQAIAERSAERSAERWIAVGFRGIERYLSSIGLHPTQQELEDAKLEPPYPLYDFSSFEHLFEGGPE